MKRNNPLTFSVKALFAGVVFITAAKGAFAQITLDWDVLAEEPPVKKETASSISDTEQSSGISLKAPVIKPSKIRTVSSKKTKQNAKQPTKKAPAKPQEKYHIQESAQKDEHDKLKPHAAPVPRVKILATNETAEPAEEAVLPKKASNEAIEPKISKHFLEQQTKQGIAPSIPLRQSAGAPLEQEQEPEKTQAATATVKPEIKEIAPEKKSLLLNFSVFPVSEKISPPERSIVLSKEIPQESATIKALSDKKTLQHILIFEKKSIDLTEEMQNTLDSIAAVMKKEKDQRLILYSYCSEDPAEPGKERQCALRRALMIRSYLITQGIHSLRVELRSQGQKGAGDKIPDRTDIVIQNR